MLSAESFNKLHKVVLSKTLVSWSSNSPPFIINDISSFFHKSAPLVSTLTHINVVHPYTLMSSLTSDVITTVPMLHRVVWYIRTMFSDKLATFSITSTPNVEVLTE